MNCAHMLNDTMGGLFSVAFFFFFMQRGQKVKEPICLSKNEKQWYIHTIGCYQQLKIINKIYMDATKK